MNLDFRGVNRVLVSEAGAEVTEIYCSSSGGGIYFHSGETEASVVSGFTISWANAYGPEPCQAGICCEDGSAPTITNCVIENSQCAGLDCANSSPTIIRCTMRLNGWEMCSGGLFRSRSSPTVMNCTIVDNYDGGVNCYWSSAPTLTHCTITGNGIEQHGGGVYCLESSPVLTNCTISENSAALKDGGFYCVDSSPTVTNCTISRNDAAWTGGGLYCSGASPLLTNCIFWDNTPNEVEGDSPTLGYCDVERGYPGLGNIDADPRFRSRRGYDSLLAPNSPCIDTGERSEPLLVRRPVGVRVAWCLRRPAAPRQARAAGAGPGAP